MKFIENTVKATAKILKTSNLSPKKINAFIRIKMNNQGVVISANWI